MLGVRGGLAASDAWPVLLRRGPRRAPGMPCRRKALATALINTRFAPIAAVLAGVARLGFAAGASLSGRPSP